MVPAEQFHVVAVKQHDSSAAPDVVNGPTALAGITTEPLSHKV